jgi:pimeloyl-ACP methyl ester carboxylesterase
MQAMQHWPVVLLPGIVTPAEVTFAALLPILAGQSDVRPKELEVYREPEPPADYRLEDEVRGVLRTADEAGFETFHLVGFSFGGAVSLKVAEGHAVRLRSLALFEPAWAGSQELTQDERETWAESAVLEKLPPDEALVAFMQLQVAPDVELVRPSGPSPPWMASRPAGIAAASRAFEQSDLDLDRLRAFDKPVYYALGGRSNQRYFGRMAERFATVFSDYTLEVFDERHHFDPPHRIEPERVARSLRQLWSRADPRASTDGSVE